MFKPLSGALKLLFSLAVVFLFPALSWAAVVDPFDLPKTQIVKKRGDFVGGGRPQARVPFVNSRIAQDSERGSMMEIDFNVSQGYGGTFIMFEPGKVSAHFNTVRFWVRGVRSAFKVELKDDMIHSFIVEKADRSKWQEIIIPLSHFSNSEHFNLTRIKEFVFVLEDHRTSPRLGKLYIDDLTFSFEEKQAVTKEKLPAPGPVAINGSPPSKAPYQVQDLKILKLLCRIPEVGKFHHFRFEASWDQRHWFYLSEFPSANQKEFTFSWNVARYPSGMYFLRGVTVDELGQRQTGEMSQVRIQNAFDKDQFLDEVERRTFDYFVKEVDSVTYLVRDRNVGGAVFSTGLSGFQFSAYVIGVERGWMERKEALRRMNRVMDYLLNEIERYDGAVPHWLGSDRKEVWEKGQGDLVETSYLLAGAFVAQNYFKDEDSDEQSFRMKVDRFYHEIKWDLFLKRKKPEDQLGLLPWHWLKKDGPSKLELRGYNEAMIVYLLALGAPIHPIPPQSWSAWASTYQKGRYSEYELIACAPLFTHQYSHLWVDFRNIRDAHANYFENSILATLANREFSLKENGYEPELWGLSASEGPNGYKAYGAPPLASQVPVIHDGTIAPTAAGGSIMFTPELSIAALKHMRDQYGERLWGPYGFKDAFNPKRDWFANVYLGLDQGPILIGIENYRTGLIWRLFMENPYVQAGIRQAGFQQEK
ncbi:MAG: hypothetical protein HY351_04350 [Candidatus Omnitrophica bacterium]|nr:hypothetical protein [Candidatus Omnitrophota bacterium]